VVVVEGENGCLKSEIAWPGSTKCKDKIKTVQIIVEEEVESLTKVDVQEQGRGLPLWWWWWWCWWWWWWWWQCRGLWGTIGIFIICVVHDEMKRVFVFHNCLGAILNIITLRGRKFDMTFMDVHLEQLLLFICP
jgi:hypothetical protein